MARLNFESKGQDMILDVLRTPKWRKRPLRVTFYGQDHGSLKQMEATIENHGLEQQLAIGGFSNDIQEIWSHHHALLLPSRYEGLPMVTVEAMLGGRIGIVTTCGRNGELVDDGATGFHIAAPTARLLDVALERAWSCRDRWRCMGELASRRIRQRYSDDPIGDFIHLLRASARPTAVRRAA